MDRAMKQYFRVVKLNFLLGMVIFINSEVYAIPLSELTRLEGARDNALTGYGLVVGLNGSGDSRRSEATVQSIANALRKFGVSVSERDLASRNVAAVMVTAVLPPFSEIGNRIDAVVSSMGDARSLSGGTLLLTPLNAVNGQPLATAQGPLTVGGYAYEQFGNSIQKNHPTAGMVLGGVLIEHATHDEVLRSDNSFALLLLNPDFRTATSIVDEINSSGLGSAEIIHAGKVKVTLSQFSQGGPFAAIGNIQNLGVIPTGPARIVINERTGTVVSGGDVRIDDVTVTHGNMRVTIKTDYQVSQPTSVLLYDQWALSGASTADQSGRTVVVPDTAIDVNEEQGGKVNLANGSTVSDLIAALNDLDLSTRDIITVLQAINRAGALHGELVVQ